VYFEYGDEGNGIVLPPAPSPIYAAALALADSVDCERRHKRIFAVEYAMYSVYARLGAKGGVAYASQVRKWGGRVVAVRRCSSHSAFLGRGGNLPVAQSFLHFVQSLNPPVCSY
ncbi:MAG: hypothetical protein RMM53_02755, partial [Bacteroidia bacterium]|nr:hypothetical protein [Bacteroidia bacterium]